MKSPLHKISTAHLKLAIKLYKLAIEDLKNDSSLRDKFNYERMLNVYIELQDLLDEIEKLGYKDK